jgi:uncharacterized protein (DUF433 family)
LQQIFIIINHNQLINKDLLKRITVDPNICHGKPCIRGLRYPVETVLELLASGMSHDEILEDYEDLELADLQASLLFAVELSKVKTISKLVA